MQMDTVDVVYAVDAMNAGDAVDAVYGVNAMNAGGGCSLCSGHSLCSGCS